MKIVRDIGYFCIPLTYIALIVLFIIYIFFMDKLESNYGSDNYDHEPECVEDYLGGFIHIA